MTTNLNFINKSCTTKNKLIKMMRNKMQTQGFAFKRQ